MLQEILKQEQEAKEFAQWIIANSSRVINEEINHSKRSPTVTELLTDKPLFFLLEAIKVLDQKWWISWHIFDDLKNQIKTDYQKLDPQVQKLFQLKLKNFRIKQALDLAEELN
ncbi:hypothetical protein [endosymbiont GvMRE of Glomus versiforme]|uniref:hypothetical protein n=1 Tax=endosymbiont GvMRE of Glomus versiforme TaxID=2039283 RepID=UPI000EC4CA6E|nr:hypothetical protein [endosymbiont GvMRE of Glomus versiforme]RHZ36760.1 hypothetical protein GvMRE_I2g76 [endosymbiont GvMRE of Glomus versiforme]